MNGTLPRILLVLVGGAVITIAVALGCALWSTFPVLPTESLLTEGDWPRRVSSRWPREQVIVSMEQALGLTSIKSWAVRPNRKDPVAVLTEFLDLLRAAADPADPEVARAAESATVMLMEIQKGSSTTDDERIAAVRALLSQSRDLISDEGLPRLRQLAITLTDQNTNFSLFVREAGWPWRALQAEARSEKSLQPRGANALPLGLWREGTHTASGRWIPLAPMWPGFLLDTVFYALLLMPVIWSPAFLIRVRRRQRGLCPDCGAAMGVESSCDQCGCDLSGFWRG